MIPETEGRPMTLTRSLSGVERFVTTRHRGLHARARAQADAQPDDRRYSRRRRMGDARRTCTPTTRKPSQTFKNGTDIDVDAYEARSFAIFREFARANGMSEAAMIDHLKLIPRQVVGIVKENPAVLQ